MNPATETPATSPQAAPKTDTYYLLSGEGEIGTWSGPYHTTQRGIRARATRERCHGDRWCSVWILIPETATQIAHVAEIDLDYAGYPFTGAMRDVPKLD